VKAQGENIDSATVMNFVDIDEREPEEVELMREVQEQAEYEQGMKRTMFMPFLSH